jgi:hypothetical protein
LHLRSPSGRRVYSALHLLLCHASKNWGLRRDSHPRPSPYEGAALTAAPPSRKMVGRPGNAPGSAGQEPAASLLKLATHESGGACGCCTRLISPCQEDDHATQSQAPNGCGRRTRTSILGFKARCPAVRRHRKKWSGRRDSHPRSLAPEASVLAATLRPAGAG